MQKIRVAVIKWQFLYSFQTFPRFFLTHFLYWMDGLLPNKITKRPNIIRAVRANIIEYFKEKPKLKILGSNNTISVSSCFGLVSKQTNKKMVHPSLMAAHKHFLFKKKTKILIVAKSLPPPNLMQNLACIHRSNRRIFPSLVFPKNNLR